MNDLISARKVRLNNACEAGDQCLDIKQFAGTEPVLVKEAITTTKNDVVCKLAISNISTMPDTCSHDQSGKYFSLLL